MEQMEKSIGSLPARVKGKVYSSVVRPAMENELETVAVTKKQLEERKVAEMKMLRFAMRVTRKEKIRNEYIKGTIKVKRLGIVVAVGLLWFGLAVPSMSVKRWNFRKTKWSHYIALTKKFTKTLLPPDSLDVDTAYQDFCNIIKKAAKKTIPSRYQNNYFPCWNAECESLYKTFLQSPQGGDSSLAATALLAKLDRMRRDRWSEAVWNIDFSHCSQKAWSILNNLTGRSRHSPHHCPVSADAIASQLVRNGKYKTVDRKHLDLFIKKCLTFVGPQHQTQ